MNLDDYIQGTYSPDNPANWDEDENDEIDVDEIEVLDFELLETNYYIVKSKISEIIDLKIGWICSKFIENDFKKAMTKKGFLNVKQLKVYKCKDKKEYEILKTN